MNTSIVEKYRKLNELAKQNGVVIFGGCTDRDIAMCELKQAFFPESVFYNRSIDSISVENAADLYSLCVAPLMPDTVLLHIGMEDLQLCLENPAEFETKYRELITLIRENNKKCDIAIINFQNTDYSSEVETLNKKLKYISDSERCTYWDISCGSTHSSTHARKEISFIYNLGFVRQLQYKPPVCDMAKVLFC